MFFGREVFTEKLIEAVQCKSLVAVFGSSGSGKSSVVFAGLFPQLRKDSSWIILELRPGHMPFDSLATAIISHLESDLTEPRQMLEAEILAKILRKQNHSLSKVVTRIKKKNATCRRILIYVDQFEELYTHVKDEEECKHFINTLLDAINSPNGHLTVLFTLRADFLGQVLAYRTLADALQSADLKLGPMNREELRRVIEKPAETQKVKFEPGLTDLILEQMENEPEALPLLEFALTKLWEHQENGTLTLKAYQKIGGIKQALSRKADEIFESLKPDELSKAHRMFTYLISQGPATETRRLAMRSEFAGNEYDPLIEKFVKERLMVTDRTPDENETVEFVHETLIHGCKTLHDWAEKNRGFLAWHAQLQIALEQWKKSGNNESALLSGLNLSITETYLSERGDDLDQDERLFILLSIERREREDAERNRDRRIKWAGGILSIATILTILTVAYFMISRQHDFARAGELAAQSELLSSTYPQRSLLLALEAIRIAPSLPSAEQALRDAMGMIGGTSLSGHNQPVTVLAFSPDGHWLATGSQDATVRLWDLTSNNPSATSIQLQGHENSITNIAFSPDGHWLATGSVDSTVRLWDLINLPTPSSLVLYGHLSGISALVFSSDGHWLATGGTDTTIWLWDLYADDILASSKPLGGPQNTIRKLAFSPDGQWLAVRDGPDSVWLWDVNNLSTAPNKLRHTENNIMAFAFSSEKEETRWIATGGTDSIVRLWDLKTDPETPTKYQTLSGHKDTIMDVTFSPDGRWLVTGGLDKDVRLWDLAADNIQANVKVLSGHRGTISTLIFSPNGRWLVTGSEDATARLWDLTSLLTGANTSLNSIVIHGEFGSVSAGAFSLDNRWLAIISSDGVCQLWDLTIDIQTGTPIVLRDINSSTLAFAPENRWLATTSNSPNVTARLWDITADDPSAGSNILFYADKVNVAVSPEENSGWLVTSSGDTVQLWKWNKTDLAANPYVLDRHTDEVTAMGFSPDGKILATGSSDNIVCLWNIPSVENADAPDLRTCLLGHKDAITTLAFSPDGRWLATGSKDKTVRLWSLTSNPSIDSKELEGSESVVVLEFSPDGRWLVIASRSPTVQVWDMMSDFSQPLLLEGHLNPVRYLDFSPDGRWLATGSWGRVLVWELLIEDDPFGGDPVSLRGVQGGISGLRFSPDSRRLAVAGKSVYLWNVPFSNPLRDQSRLDGHNGSVTALSFSPNANWLATGGADNVIRLWNLTIENPTKNSIVLFGHKNKIASLVFNPDGYWLVSSGLDYTARLWNMDIEEVKVEACRLAGRNLSQDEWRQYFPNESNYYHTTCPQWPAGY